MELHPTTCRGNPFGIFFLKTSSLRRKKFFTIRISSEMVFLSKFQAFHVFAPSELSQICLPNFISITGWLNQLKTDEILAWIFSFAWIFFNFMLRYREDGTFWDKFLSSCIFFAFQWQFVPSRISPWTDWTPMRWSKCEAWEIFCPLIWPTFQFVSEYFLIMMIIVKKGLRVFMFMGKSWWCDQ